MAAHPYEFEGVTEVFPGPGGWTHVRLPREYRPPVRGGAWGMVPVTAGIGASRWDTSLMPIKDGPFFIAVNAKVRKAEGIGVGDRVKLRVWLREGEL